MALGDQAGVREDRDQKPEPLQPQVDLLEIVAEERLSPGEEAPHRAEVGGLPGDAQDLRCGEFLGLRSRIPRGEVDVAVAAIGAAAGGDLQVEGERDALPLHLVPEGKLLDLEHRGHQRSLAMIPPAVSISRESMPVPL